MFVLPFLEKNKEMTKRVEDYIQDIVGVDFAELENVGLKFCSLCQDDRWNFQTSKLVQIRRHSRVSEWKYVYRRYYGMMDHPKKPIYLSEYFIKRKRLIDDFFGSVKPGDDKYDELYFTEFFCELIDKKLISLESLWCMEFELDHDFVSLDEEEQTIYKYYKFFAQLFLQYTNDICKDNKFLGFDYNNENEIIDYQEEIDKTLVEFFGKKDYKKIKNC